MTNNEIRSQINWLNRERTEHCEKVKRLANNIARSMDSINGFATGFIDEEESISGATFTEMKNEMHSSNGWMNTMREWMHYIEMCNEKMRWLEALLEEQEGGER